MSPLEAVARRHPEHARRNVPRRRGSTTQWVTVGKGRRPDIGHGAASACPDSGQWLGDQGSDLGWSRSGRRESTESSGPAATVSGDPPKLVGTGGRGMKRLLRRSRRRQDPYEWAPGLGSPSGADRRDRGGGRELDNRARGTTGQAHRCLCGERAFQISGITRPGTARTRRAGPPQGRSPARGAPDVAPQAPPWSVTTV